MAVASASLSNFQIGLRLHQIELRVGQLDFLPGHVDLRHTPHLKKGVDLIQMFALVLHRFLPHVDQFLRREHAEVSISAR